MNFDKLREWGTISDRDLKLIHVVNDVDEAFAILTRAITSPKAGKSG